MVTLARDLLEQQRAQRERIEFYDLRVKECVRRLEKEFGDRASYWLQLVVAAHEAKQFDVMESAARRGYALALTNDEVVKAITEGVHGRIALTYVEWAGQTTQHVVVPWTIVSSREEAKAFADAR